MLSLARDRVPSGIFLHRDLAVVDEPADSVDAVVALYVFGHLPAGEHASTFARILRWLRPNGVFCSAFPVGDGIEGVWLGVPMHFGGIGRDAAEAALERIGFHLELAEVKEEREEDGSSVAFAWVVARKPR
jgi:SAM-dependent methyltransferase